jgi:autotransporter-associated beta strand protein
MICDELIIDQVRITFRDAIEFFSLARRILGLGLNDNGAGALQTLGANLVTIGTGATAVNWNASPTVVNVGTGSQLLLNAAVGGGGNPWIKRGSGELILTGGTSNSNTGTMSINEGTLSLDKTGAAVAVAGGSIIVDDLGNYDPVGGGVVRYLSTGTSTNMIVDIPITVNHTGVFDINGKTDTVANTLTINGGTFQNTAGGGTFQVNALTMTGGSLSTSATGTLNLNGTLTYNSGLATGGFPVINGQLNLLGGNRTFAVNDGYNSTNDLTINAVISNGRVVKTGNGGLLLTNGGNTFLADINEEQAFTVNAGVTSFTIGFNAFGATLTTVPIPYSAATPASAIQAALERLSNIQPGNVLVTGAPGGPYNIQFTGALSGIDFATLTFTPTGGTITAGANINGAHSWEVQGTSSILAFSSDTALGTGRVVMNDSFATLIPVGNRNIANPITLFPSLNLVFGGRRDFTGNSSLTLSGPISLGTPATAQDLNLQIDDPLTSVVFSGPIGGGNSTGFLRLQKTGQGTLQWSGANTFVAPLNIATGILRISNSDALGMRTNELAFVQDTGAAFTLTFNGATTASIPTGSSAATVAAALNALATIGGVHGSVTVTGTGVVNATTFDPFVIEFRDALAGIDVAAVTATGATVLAITRNGAGTTVASTAALELAGNLVIGEEFITFTGVGSLPRTGTSAGFTGAIRAVSGSSSIGAGKTAIQAAGGNGQVNYVGVDTGASLVINGGIFQPTALPGGQFTHLNKVGGGTLEFQGTTPNFYGNTGILDGTLRLNKAPGVNAIPFAFGAGSQVVVGDNVGAANSDQLIIVAAEQIPDSSTVTVAGTGQLSTTLAQTTSLSNEVQQVFIPNAGPTGQFRLEFNGVSTGDLAFGASLGSIQAALNALSTIGGAGGNVIVQGSGSGQNQLFTITFLGSLAGANQAIWIYRYPTASVVVFAC